MKKLTILLLAVAVLAACNREETNLDKDISIPVSVMELKKKSIEKYISTTGTVQPVKEVDLTAQISGKYYLNVNPATGELFALGDYVEKGQEIISLEDEEYENNIKIKALELQLEISKQVFEKQQSLYDKGGVTLSELKNAEIDFINAQYSYEDAMIKLKKMHVRTPFSGVIVDLPYYTQGTKIDANAAMVSIMDYSNLIMEINLAEKNMEDVEVNQDIRIVNYTLPDDTLDGTLTQISPAISSETRTFRAIVRVKNEQLLLRPGMFAKGEIIVAASDSAIVIPKDVILNKQRGNTVFVVEKGLAQERVISFGLENPEEVEVIDGLSEDERLVVKGFETLRNRSKVKVVK